MLQKCVELIEFFLKQKKKKIESYNNELNDDMLCCPMPSHVNAAVFKSNVAI